MATYVLLVMPNEHLASSKKLKLQASSIEELAAQVAAAVKLGEDAVLCAPTSDVPSATDRFKSLAELGEKAKVMVWPARAVLDVDDDAASHPRLVTLACPEDCIAGDDVTVEIDGRQIEVQIPEGVNPGDEFDIHLPPEDAEGEANETQDDPAGDAEAESGPESQSSVADTAASNPDRGERVLLVMPNEHVASSKKLKLRASSIQELAAQVAAAVRLGEDAVLCAPTSDVPSATDKLESLAELGEKAKVMVWPARTLRTSVIPASSEMTDPPSTLELPASAPRQEMERPALARTELIANANAQSTEDVVRAPVQDGIERLRGQMSRAAELETNPDRLTELVLASMEFGEALETERNAVQAQFEAILESQENERILSRELETMEHEQATKPKGLRRLSIAASAPRRLSLAVGGGKKEDLDAMAAAAAAAAEFDALSAAADDQFSIPETAEPEPASDTSGDGVDRSSAPKGLLSIAASAPRRLSLAVGGGKKEELEAMAAAAAAAAEVGDDDGASSPSAVTSSTRPRSPRAQDKGPLDRACVSGNLDKAVRFARETPRLLVEKNHQGMLPLHEVLRHDAPIDVIRVLVELAPETLLIPNDYGRTAEQMLSKGPIRNAGVLQYLREAKDTYVNSKRVELKESRLDEARSIILMVMPNQHVSATKKLRLEATDFPELIRLVGEAVGMRRDVIICKTTDDGSMGEQYVSFDDLGELAKVMVWPAPLPSVDVAGVPNEDEAVFAAAAAIVSSRAVDEQDTRMIAEEERKVFSELMAEELTSADAELSSPVEAPMTNAAEPGVGKSASVLLQVEAERDAARRELKILRDQLQELRQSAAASFEIAQQTKDSQLAQNRTISTLRVELEAAKLAGEGKDHEIASLRREISDKQMAADLTDKDMSDLRAANDALQSQIKSLEQQLRDTTEDAEVKLAMSREEKSEIEASQSAMASSLGVVTAKVSILEQEKADAEAKVNDLTSKLRGNAGEVSKDVYDKTAAELEAAETELVAIAEEKDLEVAMLEQEKADAEAKIKDLTDELHAKAEELSLSLTHSNDLSTLRLQLSAVTEELEFETELAQEKEEAHKTELASALASLASTETAMRDLQTECDRLRQEALQGKQALEIATTEKQRMSTQLNGSRTAQGANVATTVADNESQEHSDDESCTNQGMGPILTDAHQLGVPPTLRRELKSIAAVQKLASGNDAILSIAAELALWPAVRSAEAARQEILELRRIANGSQSEAPSSDPPEGVPHNW